MDIQQQVLRRRPIRLDGFQNVVSGQTAILNIYNGFLYQMLALEFAGMTVEHMSEIRIKLNDQVVFRAPGTFFDVAAFYDGFPDANTAGILKIPFTRLDLKTPQGESLTGINVGDADAEGFIVQKIVVEVDIDAAAPAPQIKASAEVSDRVVGGGPGLIRRVVDSAKTGLVVGENHLTNFATPGNVVSTRLYLNRLFMAIEPSLVDEVRVVANRREEFTISPANNEVNQIRDRKQPVAGFIILDSTVGQLSGNWFNLATALEEFRVELDINDSAALPPVLEYYADFVGALE